MAAQPALPDLVYAVARECVVATNEAVKANLEANCKYGRIEGVRKTLEVTTIRSDNATLKRLTKSRERFVDETRVIVPEFPSKPSTTRPPPPPAPPQTFVPSPPPLLAHPPHPVSTQRSERSTASWNRLGTSATMGAFMAPCPRVGIGCSWLRTARSGSNGRLISRPPCCRREDGGHDVV